MTSVLQDWVTELPLMQQSVLLSALRGIDGVSKENPSKDITRALRRVVLVDAEPRADHSFMKGSELLAIGLVERFLEDIDPYPFHFVMHLLYAIEIVGYKHPDQWIRGYWLAAYCQIVRRFHLNPETEQELNQRLFR